MPCVKRICGAPARRDCHLKARSLAAWAAVRELTDATLSELAEKLKRDLLTLSATTRRFEVRLKNEPELARKVERLKRGSLKLQSFRPDSFVNF
jgi:hypothetical protein